MLVGMLAERAAARFGDRVALDGPDGTRTFAQLGERVTRLARGLLGLGLTPGDRVLDLQPNGCAAVEADLALATAGLVRVPLDPRLGPSEWAAIADDCGARGLVLDASFTDATDALRSGLSTVVTTEERERLIAGRPASPLRLELPATTLVGLTYPADPTGRPRGAMRTHRNRIASAQAMAQDVLKGVEPGATFLHTGPIIHTSGLFLLPFLLAGARQVLVERADAATVAATVEARCITHLALTPAMVADLLDVPGIDPARLASLRMLAYAGAPMSECHLRRAAELLTPNLVQYHGVVEAMPPLTVLSAADHARGLTDRPELLRSVGRAVRSIDLRVVDGEVQVRGEAVTPGYWNAHRRPDRGPALDRGWLRTGDRGHLDADGYLWLTELTGRRELADRFQPAGAA